MKVLVTDIDMEQSTAFEPEHHEVEGDELTQDLCWAILEKSINEPTYFKEVKEFHEKQNKDFIISGPIAYLFGDNTSIQIIKL